MPTITLESSATTQDGLSKLVALYNKGRPAGEQLNADDFTYSSPTKDTSSANPLSFIVRARPIASSSIVGHIAIRYNKIDLSAHLADYTHTASGAMRVADIIEDINHYYGITLKEGEYANVNLPAAGQSTIVAIKPTCYLYTGQFSVVVV